MRDLAGSYVITRPGKSFTTTSYIRGAFKTFSETNGLIMGAYDELIMFHSLRTRSRRSGSATAATSRR